MAAQTESSSGKAKAPRASTAAQGDSWSLPFPPKDQSPSEGPAAGVPARAADGEFGQTWWSRPAQEEQDQPPAQLSTAPYLGLFALLLALYGWLAVSHASKPGSVERLLRFVPGLESIVFKNNHLRQGLIIESIAQKTQLIRGNREVFTISGSIVNRNPVSVREIRIEAYIFDGDGKEIGRQQIAVGNPISANLIRDVEAKEISILQEIGPQKRFAIPPDESAPFLIVFLKPAKEIKSFAYRVVSVEEAA
ncbi:MAG TPA: hypothetical protein VNL14_22295 [Candidatus Acidoferrales bacterium]|nr:hypothetical protein [Candidatus Acidoferrales bacterium]